MGFGKTLTIISLIMATLDKKNSIIDDTDSDDDSDSEKGGIKDKKKPLRM